MVRRCVVALCSNFKTDTTRLHQRLQVPKTGALWTKTGQKKTTNLDGPSKHSVLCSEHLEVGCFDLHIESMVQRGYAKCRHLLPSAVPTLWKPSEDRRPNKLRKAAEKRERKHISYSHCYIIMKFWLWIILQCFQFKSDMACEPCSSTVIQKVILHLLNDRAWPNKCWSLMVTSN